MCGNEYSSDRGDDSPTRECDVGIRCEHTESDARLRILFTICGDAYGGKNSLSIIVTKLRALSYYRNRELGQDGGNTLHGYKHTRRCRSTRRRKTPAGLSFSATPRVTRGGAGACSFVVPVLLSRH